MAHVISVSPTGVVTSMHSDKFPMGFLGAQRIERASDIRWDEESQSWGIWFYIKGEFCRPGVEYAGFDSYEAARSFEVLVMNEVLLRQKNPQSERIMRWVRFMRP